MGVGELQDGGFGISNILLEAACCFSLTTRNEIVDRVIELACGSRNVDDDY